MSGLIAFLELTITSMEIVDYVRIRIRIEMLVVFTNMNN